MSPAQQRKINVEHTLVWPINPAVWGVGTRGTKIGIAALPARPAKHAPSHFDCTKDRLWHVIAIPNQGSLRGATAKLLERNLMQNAIYQLAIGFGLVLYVAASPCPFPIMAANAAEPVASNRLIDKLLVTRLTWHRGGGLLYGEATIVNRNPHSVSQVIITCEMFDERGNQIGSKSTALLVPFPPGETRVSGIEFPTTVRNMQGGACQPVSASVQSDVS
jgi:hypothetical protein